MEFPEERYVILLTDKYRKGEIGKFSVRYPIPKIKYSINKLENFLSIDSSSGVLSLFIDVNENNRNMINNSRFTISAKAGNEITSVQVTIYVLPLSFGDPLALPVMNAVKKGLKETKSIALSYGNFANITPELLDMFLKQIPPSNPVSRISAAKTRVEQAINLVKSTIINAYGKQRMIH